MTPGIPDITVEVELAELRQALAGLVEAADRTPTEKLQECCSGCRKLAAALARAREVLGDRS